MNAFINYLIEANLGLALLLLAYVVLLRKETDFNTKRLFMMTGIFASLLFPLLHLQNDSTQSIPSIGNIVSAYWLPEVVITGFGTHHSTGEMMTYSGWAYLQLIYVLMLLFLLIRFIVQFIGLIRIIVKSKGYQLNGFQIIESDKNQTTFSFFHFIFIGQADSLSTEDKKKIIRHETIHAKQFHSVDIVLLNVLGIVFWFNPLIKSYKKIFVQLHEFEADARAVENTEVNEYCNLLAKVALQSADFPLANHFNNSLTLKRIEMMRTLKHKIKPWKMMTLVSVIIFLFLVVACQDQLKDATTIAKNSSSALVVPEKVQARFDQLKKENPNSNYILVEFNEMAQQKLAELEKTYGIPNHIELFTPDGKNYNVNGNVSVKQKGSPGSVKETDGPQTFAIIEFNESVAKISESSKKEGDIFTIVEENATFEGGLDGLGKFIQQNLRYPEDARKEGKEGKVFVEFVVNTDGSISDLLIKKGIDPRLDQAALKVVEAFPKWTPGKQDGVPVRQQFVLPINFALGDQKNTAISPTDVSQVLKQFQISSSSTQKDGKKIISGTIKDDIGNPLPGTNIIIVGKTKGTRTDANGNFSIEVEGEGQLAISYIGYKFEAISF